MIRATRSSVTNSKTYRATCSPLVVNSDDYNFSACNTTIRSACEPSLLSLSVTSVSFLRCRLPSTPSRMNRRRSLSSHFPHSHTHIVEQGFECIAATLLCQKILFDPSTAFFGRKGCPLPSKEVPTWNFFFRLLVRDILSISLSTPAPFGFKRGDCPVPPRNMHPPRQSLVCIFIPRRRSTSTASAFTTTDSSKYNACPCSNNTFACATKDNVVIGVVFKNVMLLMQHRVSVRIRGVTVWDCCIIVADRMNEW